MKEKLCYELYDIINDKKMTNLFIKNIESGEAQKIEDVMIKFKYKNNISYLNLSKLNTIEYYNEQDDSWDFKFEEIIDLDIKDNDIEEIYISEYSIMIKTKLFIISFEKNRNI